MRGGGEARGVKLSTYHQGMSRVLSRRVKDQSIVVVLIAFL